MKLNSTTKNFLSIWSFFFTTSLDNLEFLIWPEVLGTDLQRIGRVHILRTVFKNNKISIYNMKYLKYIGQSIFNNNMEILQSLLTLQHLKPFQHTILGSKHILTRKDNKIYAEKVSKLMHSKRMYLYYMKFKWFFRSFNLHNEAGTW